MLRQQHRLGSAYREIVPPEDEEPVEPLVPELLLVPAAPVDGDVVVVELPDAPMPEVVPELELGAVAADEPLSEPPADPMPDAVPEADPVVLQAPRAAAHANARRVLIMVNSQVK